MPGADLAGKHIPLSSGPLGIAGPHHIPRAHQSQQDIGLLGKPYPQYGVESLMSCECQGVWVGVEDKCLFIFEMSALFLANFLSELHLCSNNNVFL